MAPGSFVPFASKACSSETGQLVGVFHDSRHSKATPVVVEITELKRKYLHVVSIQRIPVPYDVVVCWAHRPLTKSMENKGVFPTEK